MWDGPVHYPETFIATWRDPRRGWKCSVCGGRIKWNDRYVFRRSFSVEHRRCWAGW